MPAVRVGLYRRMSPSLLANLLANVPLPMQPGPAAFGGCPVARQDMGVDVHGGGDLLVPEPVLYDLGALAIGKGECGVGVAHPVELDGANSATLINLANSR